MSAGWGRGPELPRLMCFSSPALLDQRMLQARPLRTQAGDAASAAGGAGAAGGRCSPPGPNAGGLGSMGERSAYQRLTGGEEALQVMGETWRVARYPGPRPHHLRVS